MYHKQANIHMNTIPSSTPFFLQGFLQCYCAFTCLGKTISWSDIVDGMELISSKKLNYSQLFSDLDVATNLTNRKHRIITGVQSKSFQNKKKENKILKNTSTVTWNMEKRNCSTWHCIIRQYISKCMRQMKSDKYSEKQAALAQITANQPKRKTFHWVYILFIYTGVIYSLTGQIYWHTWEY